LAQKQYEVELEKEIARLVNEEGMQHCEARPLAARLVRQRRIWHQHFGRKR